jgi:hypothetical protein
MVCRHLSLSLMPDMNACLLLFCLGHPEKSGRPLDETGQDLQVLSMLVRANCNTPGASSHEENLPFFSPSITD